MPPSCVLVCSALLLFAHLASAAGTYQRTKDGKTLVWNNYPLPGDEATWSGDHDSEGYASGRGTLTWSSVDWTVQPDSSTPPRQRPLIITRYTGNMIRGKFEGPVINVTPSGKTFHPRFVDGRSVHEATNDSEEQKEEKKEKTPGAPSPTPPVEQAPKDRVISELNEQAESVLSQVAGATGNFQDVERLDSVQELPPSVAESIGSLGNRTRELRAKIGSDSTALNEYRPEILATEALSLVKQVSRDIAMSDAAEANSKLADFLQNNPEPPVENQKALWGYLRSLESLCDRLEKEAEIHLQRAQSLAAVNKTTEAIREYQEAYRTFPNPATAGKIRQLQDNSLGL